MADCEEVSSEGSSSSSSPTTPPPRHKKSKQPPTTGKGHKHWHRGRKGKRKGKGKRKSSSSASSPSHDSTDSESPDSHHVTSKESKHSKTKSSTSSRKNPKDAVDKQSALFNIFQRHYANLVTITETCVTTMTTKLYSKKLISEDVLDRVITGQDPDSIKASRVLHSIKQQIKVDPGKLRTLVEVLKEEPVFDGLAKVIMSEHKM